MLQAILFVLLLPFAMLAATFTVCIAIGIVKALWQFFKKKK